MGTIFISLGAILATISGCVVGCGVFGGFVYPQAWQICFIFLAVGVCLILFGSVIEVKNRFFDQDEKVKECLADIGAYKRQQNELKEKLFDLLKQYIDHEPNLIDVIKERSSDNLVVLLEQYPDLKASVNVTDLINKIESLRKSITAAETRYNSGVQRYNSLARQIPSRSMIPRELPSTHNYIEPEQKPSN